VDGLLLPQQAREGQSQHRVPRQSRHHLPDDIAAKCEVIQDLGADLAKYTKVWDAVKAAR
jgi:hypothetical protein